MREIIFLYLQGMSFQIFHLVRHFKNWTAHDLSTDNTLKKITQDVLVRCSVSMCDHDAKLAGHFQNLDAQCQVTDCYFQHWLRKMKSVSFLTKLSWAKKKNFYALCRLILSIARCLPLTFRAMSLSSSMSATSLPDAPPILVPMIMLPTIVEAGPGSESRGTYKLDSD